MSHLLSFSATSAVSGLLMKAKWIFILPNPYRKDLHPSLPETPALYAELIATIRELPAGFRAVFNLHVIERYPLAEIAEMLGISEQTTIFYYQAARQYCIGPLLADRHIEK
jgi:DNA-directed RNA polymerase specialized sigma24 family protein